VRIDELGVRAVYRGRALTGRFLGGAAGVQPRHLRLGSRRPWNNAFSPTDLRSRPQLPVGQK
jgi:hypothetical protein